jgi:hypothetical protein
VLRKLRLLLTSVFLCLYCRHRNENNEQENFVVGVGDKHKVIFILDFGLAKLYRVRESLIHLPIREGGLVGTPVFASIHNHLNIAQSRRDDLESIAYILIYFMKGSLPWHGIAHEVEDKETKYKLILESKQNTPIAVICEGLPSEFAEFLVTKTTPLYLTFCLYITGCRSKYNVVCP